MWRIRLLPHHIDFAFHNKINYIDKCRGGKCFGVCLFLIMFINLKLFLDFDCIRGILEDIV